MSLSLPELEAVVVELQPLVGGTVQKIAAPTQRTAIFELRIPGRTHQLLLCAEAGETRIHLLRGPRPPSPPSPLPIQNLLRAHLLPARLVGLEQLPDERILRLRFEGPAGARVLVAELLGRRGALILCDGEERILGLVPAGLRELRPGRGYAPPAPAPAPPGTRAAPRFEPDPAEDFPLSAAIEAHYTPLAEDRALEEQRRQALRRFRAALERSEKTLQRVEADLARARDAEGLRRLGDLLAPIASQIPRGATSAVATEYREEGPVEVEVPLRPELSGADNRDLYYRRYRRLSGAEGRIRARLVEVEARRDRLRSLLGELEGAEGPALEALLAQLEAPRLKASSTGRGGQEAPRLPYRVFTSATGWPIWVGKGAKANDRLTFRASRGNDLWLHARGRTGAHVVIPQPRGREVDEPTLLDACALATHFSGARGEAVAEIAQTQVKYVRKPKGSAPGAVRYVNERSRAYRHDPARIERLLRQAREAEIEPEAGGARRPGKGAKRR